MKYLYSVAYRRDPLSRLTHRMTVVATDADDARRVVALIDPAYTSTTRSPRRGRMVIPAGVTIPVVFS